MQGLYRALALFCSVLTFFGVSYIFYSGGSPLSALTAVVPAVGVVLFKRLSQK